MNAPNHPKTPSVTKPSGAIAGVSSMRPIASDAVSRTKAAADNAIMGTSGIFGNLADFSEGEVLLPNFVLRKEDGYYADLAFVEKNPGAFYEFVNRVFLEGSYFFRLDYPAFLELVHSPERISERKNELETAKRPTELRFATDVVRIPEDRRPLYRIVKTAANFSDAKYFFEPLYVERKEEEVNEAGETVEKTVSERAYLDFDEFVAHLWNKGVRYGLLESEIRAFIADETKKGWETVARQSDPIDGKDAETREVSDRLHQDKAPTILEWGRVDLRHFRNRFPQVTKDVRLIEKIPRTLGKAGKNVGGAVIEPPPPKDFDLASVSGPGTRIESVDGRVFLTSSMDGYVDINKQSNTISISEKIVHREGASMRQTGSLELEGEHFEEHGDVEENIEVSGNSIHIRKSVYGTIVSKSGTVLVEENVSSGKILSRWAGVEIKGRASNARIHAPNAEVHVRAAENSVIVGKKIIIEYARNCTIIAEEVEIKEAVSSAIGTKRVKIGTANSLKGVETVIALETPDLEEMAKPMEETTKMLFEKEWAIVENKQKQEDIAPKYRAIMDDPGVVQYREQKAKVEEYEKKWGKLTAEQSKKFAEWTKRLSPKLIEVGGYAKQLRSLDEAIRVCELEIAPLLQLKRDFEIEMGRASTGISVDIGRIMGDTVIRKRKLTLANGVTGLARMEDFDEIRKEAHSLGFATDRIFSGSAGSFSWTYDSKKTG